MAYPKKKSEQALLEFMSGRRGSKPTTANTGTKTFDAPACGLMTREAVTISHFYDENDEIVTTGWETVALEKCEEIWFVSPVSKIVTTTGGLVKYYID